MTDGSDENSIPDSLNSFPALLRKKQSGLLQEKMRRVERWIQIYHVRKLNDE
jgi:hypothetical protein